MDLLNGGNRGLTLELVAHRERVRRRKETRQIGHTTRLDDEVDDCTVWYAFIDPVCLATIIITGFWVYYFKQTNSVLNCGSGRRSWRSGGRRDRRSRGRHMATTRQQHLSTPVVIHLRARCRVPWVSLDRCRMTPPYSELAYADPQMYDVNSSAVNALSAIDPLGPSLKYPECRATL